MKWSVLDFLGAPHTGSPLVVDRVTAEADGEIVEGDLVDRASGAEYPIRNGIPRFVREGDYAASFGFQWRLFARTQIDRFNGTDITRTRFFSSSGWDAVELKGQKVLEVGCGAGRFTQVVLDTGAELYALDCTVAVDACRQNNSPHPALHLFQADLYAMPFAPAQFDRIFCYGVLQHTPDVRRAFLSMVPFLKPGGEISLDVYLKTFRSHYLNAKYWLRPLTRRINRERLYRVVRLIAPRWIPLSNAIRRIPKVGWFLDSLVPIPNYTDWLPLTPVQVVEWAILDTFDEFSPEYDQPQTPETVRAWFREAKLELVRMKVGGNMIIATGRKPRGEA